MRIVTDSKSPEDPKDPDGCNLYNIYKFFSPQDRLEDVRQRYIQGGLAYGDLKKELAELILNYFKEARIKYNELMADRGYLDAVLADGAQRARAIAQPILKKTRQAIGIE